jgi:hypothetical protein
VTSVILQGVVVGNLLSVGHNDWQEWQQCKIIGSSRKVPDFFFFDFNQIGIFSAHFLYKFSVSNFTEICPVGVALTYAGRRTDRLRAWYHFTRMWCFSLRRNDSGNNATCAGLRLKFPILIKFGFSLLKFLVPNYAEICPVGPKLIYADRQTWLG